MSKRILGLLLILTVLLTGVVYHVSCGRYAGLGESAKPTIELSLSIYPKEIAFGDTCYVLITVKNNSNKTAHGTIPVFALRNDTAMVQFDLTRAEKTWYGCFESSCPLNSGHRMTHPHYTVPRGEIRVFLAVSLQFPPLEELYLDAFWQEVLTDMTNHPNGLDFEFGIDFPEPLLSEMSGRERGAIFFARDRITDTVTIKLRNPEEMAMIEKWYQNTPQDHFPRIVGGKLNDDDPPRRVPDLDPQRYSTKYIYKAPPRQTSGTDILGINRWHVYFTNLGNRFPGDPNHPATWQGWQELEESLTPSTMRDEIRLTRILIQYCDTKDPKVLDELREWFAGMNEIQRTAMAKSLRDRTVNTRGTELFPVFLDIYHVIRQYDVTVMSQDELQRLQALGLIETAPQD